MFGAKQRSSTMPRRGGIGPGALKMGGAGRKPSMPRTPMATAPIGPPGMGGGGGPPGGGAPGLGGPGPGPMGIKKGGGVEKKRERHEKLARGGEVGEESEKHERGESRAFEKKEHSKFAMGGEVKARVRAGRDHC